MRQHSCILCTPGVKWGVCRVPKNLVLTCSCAAARDTCDGNVDGGVLRVGAAGLVRVT